MQIRAGCSLRYLALAYCAHRVLAVLQPFKRCLVEILGGQDARVRTLCSYMQRVRNIAYTKARKWHVSGVQIHRRFVLVLVVCLFDLQLDPSLGRRIIHLKKVSTINATFSRGGPFLSYKLSARWRQYDLLQPARLR